MKTTTKVIIWVIVLATRLGSGLAYAYFVWAPWRAGNLNQVVYKGWILRLMGTHHHARLQKGESKDGSGLQSNEFNFSVDKDAVGYRATVHIS